MYGHLQLWDNRWIQHMVMVRKNQTDRQTDRHTTDTQTDRQTDRQTDTQTDRQTGRQTELEDMLVEEEMGREGRNNPCLLIPLTPSLPSPAQALHLPHQRQRPRPPEPGVECQLQWHHHQCHLRQVCGRSQPRHGPRDQCAAVQLLWRHQSEVDV